MKSLTYILLIIFVFSCKKEEVTNVRIKGNVKNIVTGQNISGIKLRLTKEPISNNRPLSGNIVEYIETDADGNFEITSELSNKYKYELKITDERYFQFFGGINATSVEIQNNEPYREINFSTVAKGNLRLNYYLHTGSNIFEDTLYVSLHNYNGDPYFNPFIYVTDRTEYLSYSDIELMEGNQYASFLFRKNGVDSIFSKTYTIEPGSYTVVNIDLW